MPHFIYWQVGDFGLHVGTGPVRALLEVMPTCMKLEPTANEAALKRSPATIKSVFIFVLRAQWRIENIISDYG